MVIMETVEVDDRLVWIYGGEDLFSTKGHGEKEKALFSIMMIMGEYY